MSAIPATYVDTLPTSDWAADRFSTRAKASSRSSRSGRSIGKHDQGHVVPVCDEVGAPRLGQMDRTAKSLAKTIQTVQLATSRMVRRSGDLRGSNTGQV